MSRLGAILGALLLTLLLIAGGVLAYLIPVAGRAPVASVAAQTPGGPPSITVTCTAGLRTAISDSACTTSGQLWQVRLM